MLICIDSNQFIFGVTGADADAATLMDILLKLDVAVPHLVVKESASVEWVGAKYLISDNRHFLQEFSTDAYEVLPPAEFLRRLKAGEL